MLLAIVVSGLAYVELIVVTSHLPRLEVLGIALAPAAGAGLLFYQEGPKSAPITCDGVLRTMLAALYRERAGAYRANVMVPDRKKRKLTIRYAVNMEGHLDRHVQLPVGRGCAGRCYVTGEVTTFDFTKMEHSALGVDAKKTHLWADLRSILSFPIQREDGTNVAVLNVDSSLPIDETGFRDEVTQRAVGLYAELILPIIEAE